MTQEQVKTHGLVMMWFIENPDKGVWFQKYSGAEWEFVTEPTFHQIEGRYVQNDEYAEVRKDNWDAFASIQYNIDPVLRKLYIKIQERLKEL